MRIARICLYSSIAFMLWSSMAGCGKARLNTTLTSTTVPTETGAEAAATYQPVEAQRTVLVDGLERAYLLHIPSGLKVSQPASLVFVFHGLAENANLIQQTSGFNEIADKNGFVVVYPNGSGSAGALSWNAGACCGYALDNNINEPAFIRLIISDLATVIKIDPKRIYASGFSNGALLSYRLACEMSDTFAAVAPVSGVLLIISCQPAQPVSIIDFHGMTDNVVPYNGGGVNPGTSQPFPPVEESISTWTQLNGCDKSPKVEQTGVFTSTTYSACKDGSTVELFAVKGVGHSWPSQYIVPASQMIWDFFASHSKP